MSGIESGRFFPSLHVLDKMSNTLDVPLAEFFNFFSVSIPENLDDEISSIVKDRNDKDKQLIYKLLKAAYTVK